MQVLESLNLSLVVGLAVDYVVHLAEGYHSSTSEDRLTRTRHMLETVGISVLSGSLTTLGAAAFMFAAVILFFMQVIRHGVGVLVYFNNQSSFSREKRSQKDRSYALFTLKF